MNTGIVIGSVPVAVALLSGLAYLAVTHPATYTAVAKVLFWMALAAFAGALVFIAGVGTGADAIMTFVEAGKVHDAIAAAKAIVDVSGMIMWGCLIFVFVLWGLKEVSERAAIEKRSKERKNGETK